MNNNLVPQKRMDKNGHMVTRHVLLEGTESSQRALPSPSLRKALSDSLGDARSIMEAMHTRDNEGRLIRPNGTQQGSSIDNLSHALVKSFSPRTIEIATQFVSKGMRENGAAWKALSSLVSVCERPADLKLDEGLRVMVEATVERARIIDAAGIDNDVTADKTESQRAKILTTRSYNQANNLVILRVRDGISLPETEEEQEAQRNELQTAFLLVNVVSPVYSRDFANAPVSEAFDKLMELYKARDEIVPHLDEFIERGSIDLGLLDEMSSSAHAIRDGIL